MKYLQQLNHILGINLLAIIPVNAETNQPQPYKLGIGTALTGLFGWMQAIIMPGARLVIGNQLVWCVFLLWCFKEVSDNIVAIRQSLRVRHYRKMAMNPHETPFVRSAAALFIENEDNLKSCWSFETCALSLLLMPFVWAPVVYMCFSAQASGNGILSAVGGSLLGGFGLLFLCAALVNFGILSNDKDLQRAAAALNAQRIKIQIAMGGEIAEAGAKMPLGRGASPPVFPCNQRAMIRSRPDFLPLDIVLIDDEADQRELMSYLYEEYGHNFRSVSTPAELMLLIASSRVDVVLCDLYPFGMEVIQTLRSSPATANLPVIAVTALAKLDLPRLLKVGFNDAIAKPIGDEFEKFVSRSLVSAYLRKDLSKGAAT